ncbi:MAG: hypothetical protein Q4A84_06140 [Neisseria sp.]|uniref:hypothetical protein n=1 Tax=Neisseria sp. TaxID=192066 RepID=UPI0026DAE695|nr:hypothetical protein [Neisseria sp.]MDO4641266.1 hypothetical protein [Neisseria sp.]
MSNTETLKSATAQITAAKAVLSDQGENLNAVFPHYDMAKNVFSGNVLENASNTLNGESVGKISVQDFTLDGKTYQAGEIAKGDNAYLNSFTVLPDGRYLVDIKDPYANTTAFKVGYTVSNGSETVKSALDVNVEGWGLGLDPLDAADIRANDKSSFTDAAEWVNGESEKISGNVLDNTINKSGPEVKIDGYVINGMKYHAGETAGIFGIGTFKLNADGTYALSAEGQKVTEANMPDVSYIVNNGSAKETSSLYITLDKGKITVAPYPEANVKANPLVDLSATKMLAGYAGEGNVLDKYEGSDKPYIAGFNIGNAYYAAGQTVKVDGVGEFTMNRDGSYKINAVDAKAAVPDVSYTVTNGYKASSSTLHFELDKNTAANGDKVVTAEKTADTHAADSAAGADVNTPAINDAAEVRPAATDAATLKDSSEAAAAGEANNTAKTGLTDDNENETFTSNVAGNVLDNATNGEGGAAALSVTAYEINGNHYAAGESAQFDAGTFTLNADGSYQLDTNMSAAFFESPKISYTVSNGTETDTSELQFHYDWAHLEGSAANVGHESSTRVLTGDNQAGQTTNLTGSAQEDNLLVGDSHKGTAVDNQLDAGSDLFGSGHDVLVGDRLNIDTLEWQAGGTTVKGSSYDNAVEGLRDYLKATDVQSDGSDADVLAYVRENYAELLDTNPQGGNDTLFGSHNDDIIIGNAGNDTLTGHAGSDTFVFTVNSNSGHDVITDFTVGQDKLLFSDLVDSTKLVWDTDTRTLSFSGVQDGQTYENSITIQNAPADLKLEDLLATSTGALG